MADGAADAAVFCFVVLTWHAAVPRMSSLFILLKRVRVNGPRLILTLPHAVDSQLFFCASARTCFCSKSCKCWCCCCCVVAVMLHAVAAASDTPGSCCNYC